MIKNNLSSIMCARRLDQAIADYTAMAAHNEYTSQDEYLAAYEHMENEKKKLMKHIEEGRND